VNPERANNEDAVKVHGLTDDFLADKPPFGAIADQLLDYVAGAEIVIHNAEFDVAFLNQELRRLGRPDIRSVVAKVTDSLQMARDAWPGKSNSLDALCKRLEVDNASRTLHGALLDAGLLCEVYIRMTRGQDSLVIEAVDGHDAASGEAGVDLRTFELIVIEADESECAAHAALLVEIDKASGGRTVWRSIEAMQVAVAVAA
jgi:DNA polymerase-3 subunit epsilon